MIRKGLVEVEDPDGELIAVGKAGAKLKVPWESCPWVDGFDFPPPPLLCGYHKPLGPTATTKDDKGRLDFSSVLPLSWQKPMQAVDRLDDDTTGLLLFCREGELTHRLMHPKFGVEKEYVATVEGAIDVTALGASLEAGVSTDAEELSVRARLLEVDGQTVRLVVNEGDHRCGIVRRLLASVGHPVIGLHRVRFGEVRLDALDIDEGESAAVEEEISGWAFSLKAASSHGSGQTLQVAPDGAEAPPSLQATATEGAQTPRPKRPTPQREARDLEAEMEEAARREWQPPESLVAAVEAESGVTRQEALDALRRHEGDVVAALEDVLDK